MSHVARLVACVRWEGGYWVTPEAEGWACQDGEGGGWGGARGALGGGLVRGAAQGWGYGSAAW
jgi:hypothetical protein